MTWVMIAEDTCNALAKVDEPLPVRPSQSDRRQLMGNHVKNQVTTQCNDPKAHDNENIRFFEEFFIISPVACFVSSLLLYLLFL